MKTKETKKVEAPKSTKTDMLCLTIEQTQAIGNYLVQRPYGEVEKLIEILKAMPKVQVEFAQQPTPELPVAGEDSAPEAVKQ